MSAPIDELDAYLREQIAFFREMPTICGAPGCETCVNNSKWADKLQSWVDAVANLRNGEKVELQATPPSAS